MSREPVCEVFQESASIAAADCSILRVRERTRARDRDSQHRSGICASCCRCTSLDRSARDSGAFVGKSANFRLGEFVASVLERPAPTDVSSFRIDQFESFSHCDVKPVREPVVLGVVDFESGSAKDNSRLTSDQNRDVSRAPESCKS